MVTFQAPKQPPNKAPAQPNPMSGGLGLMQKPDKKPDPAEQKAVLEMNTIMTHLRILEERYTNLRKKNQLTDENMLEDSRKLSSDIRLIQENLVDFKKELSEIKTKLAMLYEEIGQTAKKSDYKVLSRYLDMWEPMGFVSADEAKKMVEEAINERLTKRYLNNLTNKGIEDA